jgi:hypothetical protein
MDLAAAERPTEIARVEARAARLAAKQAQMIAVSMSYEDLMAVSAGNLASAVEHLATGLRATYMLLQHIQREQKMRRP